jgi:hypothetical protein
MERGSVGSITLYAFVFFYQLQFNILCFCCSPLLRVYDEDPGLEELDHVFGNNAFLFVMLDCP